MYLESQSKRILERRGVDTRDGVEGAWEGRRPGGEEVKGLEAVVEGLGRGKEGVVEEASGKGSGDVVEDGEEMDMT